MVGLVVASFLLLTLPLDLNMTMLPRRQSPEPQLQGVRGVDGHPLRSSVPGPSVSSSQHQRDAVLLAPCSSRSTSQVVHLLKRLVDGQVVLGGIHSDVVPVLG